MNNLFSISIPVYNNHNTIVSLIQESKNVLAEISENYEIFVINDGSIDGSKEVLEKISKEDKYVTVVHHGYNKGFGDTIKEVFILPRGEYIFFIPGDGQIPPGEIKKFLPYIDKFDYIIGVRKKRQDSWLRKTLSSVYNVIISLISGKTVHDVNSVALLKKKCLQDIDLKSKSAFIHAEIYLKLVYKGYKIKEIEIDHKARKEGKSGAFKIRVVLQTIYELFLYLIGRL